MTSARPASKPSLATTRPSAGAIAQAMAAACWLPQAALLALAVQRIADGNVALLGFNGVVGPALGIVLLGLLRASCEAWGLRSLFTQARARLSAMRADVAQSLATRSPLDRSRPASGLAASVIAEQAEAVLPWLVRYQPARWRVMTVPLLILLAVAWLSWASALVLLVSAPLIPLFMAIVGWRAKAASEAQMLQLGGMNAFLLDRLRGLATLRALGAVDATALRLRDSAQSLRQRTMAVLRIAFLSSAVLELFAALGVAMVAVYVGFHLLGHLEFGAWGRRLTLGEGLFILLLAPAFFDPLRELSAVWHDRQAGEAALEALQRIGQGGVQGVALIGETGADATAIDAVDRTPTLVARSMAEPQSKSAHQLQRDARSSWRHQAPAVVIRQLTFSHPGEAALYEGLDVTVAANEHVALMGPSGSGKTALLSLIAGLLPTENESTPKAPNTHADGASIVIGGVPLTAASAASLRARIGWIGQQPHVFAGNVAGNISLGREGVDADDVRSAIDFAGLQAVEQAHPATALGEGGAGLSGGEAVRLALARVAVHVGADLLLVDEPTAHLDRQTAVQVIDALMQLARGKTLIVATHDPMLAARVHRVIRLDASVEQEAA